MIMGMYSRPMAKAMKALVMYMFVRLMVFIQEVREKGTATDTAFRRKATPTKASAVSCFC